jgi:hypothetical protein
LVKNIRKSYQPKTDSAAIGSATDYFSAPQTFPRLYSRRRVQRVNGGSSTFRRQTSKGFRQSLDLVPFSSQSAKLATCHLSDDVLSPLPQVTWATPLKGLTSALSQ